MACSGGSWQKDLISLAHGSFIPKDSKDIPIYLGTSGRELVCTELQWKGFKGQMEKAQTKGRSSWFKVKQRFGGSAGVRIQTCRLTGRWLWVR